MKILVLFTGGTIGSIKVKTGTVNGKDVYQIMTRSIAKERGYDYKNSQSLLVELYNKRYNPNKEIEFDTEEIADALSEKMNLAKWNEITNIFRNYDFRNYYGVIITHGTDTLGYFANYLSMILNNVDIPVVVVSSNYELEDPRANGLFNFQAACDFIKNELLPGVYVTYRNTPSSETKTKLIYGSRILQCSAPTNDFESISINGNVPLGYINDNGKVEIIDKELYSRIKLHSILNYGHNSLINNFGSINSKVLIVEPYVGLDYNMYNVKNIDAILHTLYHSGTACADADISLMNTNNVINFAKMIKNSKTNDSAPDLFAGPIYGSEDREIYSTTNDMIAAGIPFVMNTSKENAYAKLLIAYACARYNKVNSNQVFDYVKTFMTKEFNNEFILPAKTLVKR